eukprot:CAMPEP_0184658044 /NCGR_PEP_ID=MMETSP0308-20130426/23342_1 /TAXON_ID=38269 /ORGANISM="Gloeochaete witrockiana, Strain SAG 46.84" /LENGTH=525 /DNA_ID=CAMNT_0027096621 /DNA_START=190 /DNA_END=1764 /DNA_ORIENTATION=-
MEEEHAIEKILAAGGSSGLWVLGEVWKSVENGNLVLASSKLYTFGLSNDTLAAVGQFALTGPSHILPPGQDLPGRLIFSGEPEWIENIEGVNHVVFRRRLQAIQSCLRTAVGLPISVRSGRYALLLFATQKVSYDENLLKRLIEDEALATGAPVDLPKSILQAEATLCRSTSSAEIPPLPALQPLPDSFPRLIYGEELVSSAFSSPQISNRDRVHSHLSMLHNMLGVSSSPVASSPAWAMSARSGTSCAAASKQSLSMLFNQSLPVYSQSFKSVTDTPTAPSFGSDMLSDGEDTSSSRGSTVGSPLPHHVPESSATLSVSSPPSDDPVVPGTPAALRSRPDCGDEVMSGSSFSELACHNSHISRTSASSPENGSGANSSKPQKKRKSLEGLSFEVVARHFSMSAEDASNALGVSLTSLKKVCRRMGISRWPWRKVQRIGKQMQGTAATVSSSGSDSPPPQVTRLQLGPNAIVGVDIVTGAVHAITGDLSGCMTPPPPLVKEELGSRTISCSSSNSDGISEGDKDW